MGGGWHALSATGRPRRRDRARGTKRSWLLAGGIVVVCALLFVFITRGVRIQGLRQSLAAIRLDQAEALIERQDLEQRLALKDDLTAIEDAAREQLGWVLPGEERVLFIDSTGDSEHEGE